MSAATHRYIVVRTGSLDELDAIAEVDATIGRSGACWFGKYGLPIGDSAIKSKAGVEVAVHAVLVQSEKTEECGYSYGLYRLNALRRSKPPSGPVPDYYKRVMHRFGCWLDLSAYDGPEATLSDLVVSSSLNPLLFALRSSVRGHFTCRLK